jgi:hypothetical protein
MSLYTSKMTPMYHRAKNGVKAGKTLASLLKNSFNTPLPLRNLPCGVETGITSGCSKRPSSKAAGESKPEAYPLGYVEDFDEPRTPLADFFSILPTQGVRPWPR